ncbi:hypothetical protein CQW23_26598 [Capsicum baccatum]|uniref:Ubiquitin-like protease family profile domain-containing protein n=1 Tax=Capsicum baccatum TaxID=33114 RepID=A0A2G2VP93_CAPBA|nr:hypothetical protein CQW23_26598 [Capsicum baccatum]
MDVMFNDNGKVVFKNIEPTKKELAKLQIPKKDAIKHERYVDSDGDFHDPPPRKINEHSKKKQKVDSSTPVAKKPLKKKQVNEHTPTRTPSPRATKANEMKTPVFKSIPIQQASFSKMKKGKQTTRVIFPQVQSKPDIHVEEVALSKPESHVEKETFISKKDFDAFRDEVRREFKGIRGLMRKKFKKMKKTFAQSKDQVVDIEADTPNVDDGGLEQSGQHFSPDVVQSSDNISDDKDPNLQNMNYVGTERSPQRLSSEGCTDLHSKKMNVEIDSQQLIPDELLRSINLDYLHSEKVVQHDCRTSDEKIDEIILSDSQFTIPDEMLPSLNAYQIKSIIIHPSANRQEEHEILDAKTSETVIEDHAQRDEQLRLDSQNTIPDEFLPSLNVYDQTSIMIHPSANREVKTSITKLRIRRSSKFKESLYTKKFGSAAGSSAGLIRIFPQKHSFLYHPIDGIIDTKIVKNFKDWISVDLLKATAKRSLNDVYSMDHQNLNAGGQENHLIEYINGFRIHAAVPWHTVEDIFIPVNIKETYHWVLAILSFSERCIFLYDSYEFSDHYAAVLAEIEKIATIIPFCFQACDFHVKKGIDLQNHPRYKDKEFSDMFDVLFEDDLPQQLSGSLYVVLLWDYGIRKQDANAISDVEAPLRLARQSRITSVTEVVDV